MIILTASFSGLLYLLYNESVKMQIKSKHVKEKEKSRSIPEVIEFVYLKDIDTRDIKRDWDWANKHCGKTINGQLYTEVRHIYHRNRILHIPGSNFDPDAETSL